MSEVLPVETRIFILKARISALNAAIGQPIEDRLEDIEAAKQALRRALKEQARGD